MKPTIAIALLLSPLLALGCATASEDPPATIAICGNGTCETAENAVSCPGDCMAAAACGDGVCNGGETPTSCATDCDTSGGMGAICGNGVCQLGEDADNCAADCAPATAGFCGNGTCDTGESLANCAVDCSPPSACGNGVCETGEDAISCPGDCNTGGGGGGGVCGNAVCEAGELTTCPVDCGGSCCGPTDTCAWACDGICDCGGTYAWDDCDCAGGGSGGGGGCCTATDPCGWANDGICDCSGAYGWDAADCGGSGGSGGGGGSGPTCGDGVCDTTETTATCPADCGSAGGGGGTGCYNGVCEEWYEFIVCPTDCGCGDGICTLPELLTCSIDCTSGGGGGGGGGGPVDCCADASDPCGWYGDGWCDEGCAWGTDPDCGGGGGGKGGMSCCTDASDPCAWNGDSICDSGCAWGPDVDCTPTCGDGTCEMGENATTCPSDCSSSSCGDGTCDPGEDSTSCPADCTGPVDCCGDASDPCNWNGDGFCDVGCAWGTDVDCGPVCGDGSCDTGETSTSCPADCGPVCGDGTCDAGETSTSCPADCMAPVDCCGDASDPCAWYGDGWCDTGCSWGADIDCGPICGDGWCDPGEDSFSCPGDCGAPVGCCGDPADGCGWNGDGFCDVGCAWGIDVDCAYGICTPDGFEPNDSSPAATTVADEVTYCGLSLCGGGDVDWFELTVLNGFTADVTFLHAAGDMDLEIYDGTTWLYVTGSYTSTDDESITLTGLAPGIYWARTYVFGGGDNADYCFGVDTW